AAAIPFAILTRMPLQPMQSRNVAPLFAGLHRELIATLRQLDAAAWNRPTVAGEWRVRDVAGHLLDGDLRNLSAHRDSHLLAPDSPPRTYEDVVALINSLNASGVSYAARLSPQLLVALLDVTGRWVSEFIEALDPFAPALFPVAWAGEMESQNWMDTGREYTERWHHQMQIRDAVGAPLLLSDEWYEPLLDFSVRALPRAYRDVAAPDGTALTLNVGGDDALAWSIVRHEDGWRLYQGYSSDAAATVRISRDHAWRLFYNAMKGEEAAAAMEVSGDHALAAHLLAVRSVMV
ncbi:MAG TPA: maleylpyruvate isomerase N-terminal domain-containing protein, partial [Thermoanaerobaculia bacterium]|nr:maleylpyruvate isomerase N-terminal domain-containing protein [Thermoanaerobaculia bacterium]